MELQRNRNMSSDKGKLHFYKGREPTAQEVNKKGDHSQALIVDEVQEASIKKMRIVITWIPPGGRQRFRKSMDRIDPKLKKSREAKFSNTSPEERLELYEDVVSQDVEFYDSFPVQIPSDVNHRVSGRHGREVGYWEARYLYQLEDLLRRAIADHAGYMDIVIDKPPFDIVEDIGHLCQILIDEGCEIQWVTISPSRHIPELQVHDFVAGLDYDLNTGQYQEDKRIDKLSNDKKRRYAGMVSVFKSKIRRRRGVPASVTLAHCAWYAECAEARPIILIRPCVPS